MCSKSVVVSDMQYVHQGKDGLPTADIGCSSKLVSGSCLVQYLKKPVIHHSTKNLGEDIHYRKSAPIVQVRGVSAGFWNDCEQATVPAFVIHFPIAKLINPVKDLVSVLAIKSFDHVWRDSVLIWGFVIC